MVGFNATSAILRGIGDSKTPLGFLVLATVLNIVLDLVFILVFGWGIAGAAWATVIAQGFSFVSGILYLNRTHPLLRLNLRRVEFDRKVLFLSLRIGIPSGIQQMLVAAGMMALSRIVNSFGTPAVAAFAAAGRIDTFAGMPAMNLSLALANFTGQNMGAGKPERVVRGYHAALAIASAISLCITLISVVFGKSLIAVFNSDPEVVRIGASYLAIVGLFYVLFSSMFTTNGVIRGAGDTTYSMLNTILALWLVRVPAATLLSRHFGTDGIWWSMPAGWAAGFGAAYLYYRSGRWKKRVIIRKKAPA
jgi:putative MATE family efflux protein